MEQYRELFKIKRLKACQHQLFEENTHSLLYRFDIIKPLCHKCSAMETCPLTKGLGLCLRFDGFL